MTKAMSEQELMEWARSHYSESQSEVDDAINVADCEALFKGMRLVPADARVLGDGEDNSEFKMACRLAAIVSAYELPPAVMTAAPADVKSLLPPLPTPINIPVIATALAAREG